jgi:hypothetical protein
LFTTDNQSGWKTREDRLKTHEPELCDAINEYTKHLPDLFFRQRIYHYIYEMKEIPTCKVCGKLLEFGRSIKEGYNQFYCSVACNNRSEDFIQKAIKTKNYDEILKKSRATTKEKYGVENLFMDKNYIQQKTMEKYGVTSVTKLQWVKEKAANTNMERYGVTNRLKDKKIRDKMGEKALKDAQEKYPDIQFISVKKSLYTIVCGDCNQTYTILPSTFKYRKNRNLRPCVFCTPLEENSSLVQKDLFASVSGLSSNVIYDTKNIIPPKELDIYFPDKKIGIEFNGLYYHSETFKENNYHKEKLLMCKSVGIRLIQVFEDEWINTPEIVLSIIKSKLGLSKKIYARNCVVKNINKEECAEFLNKNHIQGNVGATHRYGLYYNDELVSVMTFGPARVHMGGKKKDGEFEMYRYCSKINTTVVGGPSKLLSFFIGSENPQKITTYADLRYSDGNVYEKIGFTYVKTSSPNYYYLDKKYKIRMNRFKFRKDILIKEGFDKNKSEREIMIERGFHRIYDCGHIRYEWNRKK